VKTRKKSFHLIIGLLLVVFMSVFIGCETFRLGRTGQRHVINLNGTWEIAEGGMDSVPKTFEHKVPVPGLVDVAEPAFDEVGTKSDKRQAFWYRRTFNVNGPIPEIALLKIHKAKYGTRIFLNGELIGDHLPCFTPSLFDVREYLKGSGATNEIIVRVGAFRDSVPESIPSGWDFEKYKYIPGIYDSVEIILTGVPYIVNVQTVPDIATHRVRVVTELYWPKRDGRADVSYEVSDANTGKFVGAVQENGLPFIPNQTTKQDVTIPIEDCKLWTPENPFLYELKVDTGGDCLRVRFGMRSFGFDKESGRAILNGKPYFMRGTNVCVYRFFEDAVRGDRPWRKEWVRRLHRKFKSMHWNSIRYCIGFPPEIWYEIADEEGLLIQDEFPIWGRPETLRSAEIAKEYNEWMHERWNHPCVVIWDAQNETVTEETGKAIQAVRHLDLSNRPWENGWSPPQEPDDCFEAHPYMFSEYRNGKGSFRLADLESYRIGPRNSFLNRYKGKAVTVYKGCCWIINEYGWLWLNRDGTPTTLSKGVYQSILGPDASVEQLRRTYARYLAALTEFWRCNRACAGVLHFCGLGYCRTEWPHGQTSDNFLDIETLEFEPYFERYVKDAFSPVGLCINKWDEQFSPGAKVEVPVIVINDLYKEWKGNVVLRILSGGVTIFEQEKACVVGSLGQETLSFKVTVPNKHGKYQLAAELNTEGTPVRSLRDFNVASSQ